MIFKSRCCLMCYIWREIIIYIHTQVVHKKKKGAKEQNSNLIAQCYIDCFSEAVTLNKNNKFSF